MSEVARYKAIIVDADRTIREQADRIEALESCLRQAREAIRYHISQTRPIHQTLEALAAIDAVLSGAPVKEG